MKLCTNIILLGLLCTYLCANQPASAPNMKLPDGCIAAPDAKTGFYGYADKVIHEKTGIELVLISPGSFQMGSNSIGSNAMPIHTVTLKDPFYMGKTEVTNAQYRKFIEATKYDGKADTDPAYDYYLKHWNGKSLMSKEDNYPVVWVSWKNAQAFCKWAELKLPSEAQWEYACRAGTKTIFYFGNDQQVFTNYGWALTNSNALTHAVAQLKPNAWGLYDMLGNVWEWTEDDYVYKYDNAPTDGTALKADVMTKALRGGSWSNSIHPVTTSCATRFNSAPGNASDNIGFRVILPLTKNSVKNTTSK